MEELDVTRLAEDRPASTEDARLRAILEAIVYVTDEPLSAQQMAAALERPIDVVKRLLDELVAEWAGPEHGLAIREVAGGYKMSTKPEHHEAVRAFVKKLTPPLKLSLPALETLAVVAYKQPVTAPEIMDIRGVQGAGVLKTLLDRKLIAESGRKNVVGKPILYKTTKDFLVQFGLKDLHELPTLKEFEELGRMEIAEPEAASQTNLPLTESAQADAADAAAATEMPAGMETVREAETDLEAGAPTAERSTGNDG
jgi:segregation and condensation protein B